MSANPSEFRPFWDRLAAHGNAAAMVDAASGRRWSYGELAAEVAAGAERLAAAEKKLVFVFARNDPGTVLCYLAALAAGHAVHLAGHDIESAAAARLIENYRPELVFASRSPEGLPAWAEAYRAEAPLFGCVALSRPGRDGPVHPELGLLLATSGSTGSAKLVRLSRRALDANARQIVEALSLTPQERGITSLPISYSYGLSVVNSHLACGGSIVLHNVSLLARGFWRVLEETQVTHFAGVPFTYDILRRIGVHDMPLPALRTLTQAGGRMSEAMIRWLHETFAPRGVAVIVMYGQTEACARICVLPPELLPAKIGAVGRPVPGGRIAIGAGGEILYEGPNVMMGYALSREDLARGDDMGGRLPTGDLGRIDADGCLWITGRLKRIAKLFGYRIDLDEVEARLRPLGSLAVVSDDSALYVCVEDADEADLAAAAKALALEMGVPPTAIAVRKVNPLPRSHSGKVLFDRLLDAVR